MQTFKHGFSICIQVEYFLYFKLKFFVFQFYNFFYMISQFWVHYFYSEFS